MLKKIFAYGAALIFFLSTPVLSDQLDGRIAPNKYLSPIQETVSGCTTWHVGHGYWVTAAHCVEPLTIEKNRDIQLYDTADQVLKQTPIKILPGKLAYYASRLLGLDDFAVIKTDLPDGYDLGELEIACKPAPVGEAIHITGFPGQGTTTGLISWGKMTHWGHVASDVLDRPASWLHSQWLDISNHGGFSGSAVQRDSDNKVVGVVTGVLTANMSMTLVTPMKKICAVLELE